MSYEELDKWIDTNAPGLNKRVLHTKVKENSSNSVLNSESQSLIINIESEEQNNNWFITTYDKTFQEMYDAYYAGQRIVLLNYPSAILVEIGGVDDTRYASFANPYFDHDNNNALTWDQIDLAVHPDNEKLLQFTDMSVTISDGGNTNIST